jgi:uncharacterized low-complexity protein
MKMSKKSMKPVATAIGAAFAGSMLIAGAASAGSNPFALSELNGGYLQIAGNQAEGKCGGNMPAGAEGKCGGSAAAMPEGKCGGSAAAMPEGKCGGSAAAMPEGKCGGSAAATMPEGKCGAGKCGANKK